MKVNVGRQASGKKYRHNLPKNVYTSSQFGFLQPSVCRELCAQDTVSIRVASSVLLQPVAKPTFGRVFLKQYCSFVPIEELYHPFPSMLKGESYRGVNSSYIPQSVPTVSLAYLTFVCYMMGSVEIWRGDYISDAGDLSQTVGNLLKVTSDAQWRSDWSTWITELVTYFDLTQQQFDGVVSYALSKGYFTKDENDPLGRDYAPDYYDWYSVIHDPLDDSKAIVISGRLSDRGRNFRKILIGCGYQCLFDKDVKTVLPLFAFYKVWFDLFAVQRSKTWKDSYAYGILERVEQVPSSFMDLTKNNSDVYNVLKFLMTDLTECYYTQNPDYASAHINGTGIGSAKSEIYLRNNLSTNYPEYATVEAEQDSQPKMVINNQNSLTQQGLDILKKLYQRVNTNTAIGGRIAEYMRTIFGADYKQENESNFIGASSVNIDITRVNSTAETSEGYLGEFAGKGEGQDRGNTYKFTAKQQGYLINMFCIIPDTRLCQAVDPNLDHIQREDYFDPAFDAITLLPTKKMSIFGVSDMIRPRNDFRAGFGNIPNYTEYKVSFDTLNGDMSLPSVRTSYLPFTLGRYIVPGLSYVQTVDDVRRVVFVMPNLNNIVNGDKWRYIGLDRWLGNFDRIFVNQGTPESAIYQSYGLQNPLDQVALRLDDNFVVYQFVDMSVTGYQLPMADSFQTDSFGDHISVEKA